MYCSACGAQVSDKAKFCSNCGSALNQEQQNDPAETIGIGQNVSNDIGLPMRWHGFLVYFGIWAEAFIDFVLAVFYLTGAIYDLNGLNISELVYAKVEGLKTVDIIWGIILIVTCLYGLSAAYKMFRYKSDAIMSFKIFLIVEAANTLVYGIITVVLLSNIPGVSIASPLSITIISFALNVAIFIINSVYYKRRARYFVN